jgi:hypothetical protein
MLGASFSEKPAVPFFMEEYFILKLEAAVSPENFYPYKGSLP